MFPVDCKIVQIGNLPVAQQNIVVTEGGCVLSPMAVNPLLASRICSQLFHKLKRTFNRLVLKIGHSIARLNLEQLATGHMPPGTSPPPR